MKERFTVGDLREQLELYPDHYELAFGDAAAEVPLTFYRTKMRGDSLVQIEFNELVDVTKSDEFPSKHGG